MLSNPILNNSFPGLVVKITDNSYWDGSEYKKVSCLERGLRWLLSWTPWVDTTVQKCAQATFGEVAKAFAPLKKEGLGPRELSERSELLRSLFAGGVDLSSLEDGAAKACACFREFLVQELGFNAETLAPPSLEEAEPRISAPRDSAHLRADSLQTRSPPREQPVPLLQRVDATVLSASRDLPPPPLEQGGVYGASGQMSGDLSSLPPSSALPVQVIQRANEMDSGGDSHVGPLPPSPRAEVPVPLPQHSARTTDRERRVDSVVASPREKEERSSPAGDVQRMAAPVVPRRAAPPPETPLSRFLAEFRVRSADEVLIRDLINTLHDRNELELGAIQGEMRQKGRRLEHLHSLRFLSFVLNDPQLRRNLNEVRTQKFLMKTVKWNGFCDDITKRLNEYERARNLQRQLAGFAASVGINERELAPFFRPSRDKKRWKNFLNYLLDHAQRPGRV